MVSSVPTAPLGHKVDCTLKVLQPIADQHNTFSITDGGVTLSERCSFFGDSDPWALLGSLMPSGVNPDNRYVLDVTESLETLTNAQATLLAGYTHSCVCCPRDAPKLQLFFLPEGLYSPRSSRNLL